MNATGNSSNTQLSGNELQTLESRLLRLKGFAAADSGFSGARSALVACVEELETLHPHLTEYLSREHEFLTRSDTPRSSEFRQNADRRLAENRSRLRELHALLESGRRLLDDCPSAKQADPIAQALNAYLVACVNDLLRGLEAETSDAGSGKSS